jgi:predicted small secreted protein
MIKKFLAPLMAAAFLSSTLTACNTMEGAGKDIEQGGKAIKEEARETKQKM